MRSNCSQIESVVKMTVCIPLAKPTFAVRAVIGYWRQLIVQKGGRLLLTPRGGAFHFRFLQKLGARTGLCLLCHLADRRGDHTYPRPQPETNPQMRQYRELGQYTAPLFLRVLPE